MRFCRQPRWHICNIHRGALAVCEIQEITHTWNCTGGLDVIRKEAWPFYGTISGVRPCCSKNLKDLKDLQHKSGRPRGVRNPRYHSHLERKEAWPFYRTISGVRLYWELEQPQGPKDITHTWNGRPRLVTNTPTYRGTSLIRNHPTFGPCSRPMSRALWLSQGC